MPACRRPGAGRRRSDGEAERPVHTAVPSLGTGLDAALGLAGQQRWGLQTSTYYHIIDLVMIPLFQLFEFSYLDGLLFYDRSGALSRRLQEQFPGLAFKTSSLDQRDFVLPAEDLDLYFGIALSRIQTLAPGQQEFPSTAARFLQIVTEV